MIRIKTGLCRTRRNIILSLYILSVLLTSCNSQPKNADNSSPAATNTDSAVSEPEIKHNKEVSWIGTLNGNIPVFLHYQEVENLIIGEITYLNTKNKLPIKLIGTVEDDKRFRLMEFEQSGNITGIITGTPSGKSFNGSWFSPKTRKELSLNLALKDTIINTATTNTQLEDIFGQYHYQYTEAGSQGDLEITQLSNAQAIFAISSVTSEPARNLARIEEDTINLNTTQFRYKLPGTDNCEFDVKFYKDFVYIKYTKGFCDGQFGNNASIDGIFLKTP